MSFAVDPANLRANGRAIEDSGAAAGGDLGPLHDRTLSDGNAPWGTKFVTNDLISGLYQELTALTGEALGLVADGLAAGGSGVRQMADTYQRADDGADADLHRIGDSVGGPA